MSSILVYCPFVEFNETSAGVDFKIKLLTVGGKRLKLTIWDTGNIILYLLTLSVSHLVLTLMRFLSCQLLHVA